MRIEYHPAVEDELLEIRDYYERQSPGLGRQFIEAFQIQVTELAKRPERWMVVQGSTRRCLMQRFPYIICFRRVEPDLLRVTVVKHQRRHPSYGRNRE